MKRSMVGILTVAMLSACGGGGGGNTGGGSGGGDGTGGGSSSGGGGGSSSGGGGGASSGGGGGSSSGGGGGSSATGWRKITPPDSFSDSSTYVYGVYCTAVDKCVLGTSGGDEGGGVFALTGTTGWGVLLVDGSYKLGAGELTTLSGTLGDLDVIGFVPTRTGVVARITTSGAVVVGSGDLTQKSSWHAMKTGSVVGGGFGLNATLTLQSASDTDWVFANNNGFVYNATSAPGASTQWTQIWSPNAVPSVPADFPAQFAADHTLCDWDISTSAQPYPSQSFYASTDLSVMVYPAFGLNQSSYRELNNLEASYGDNAPGVCISTDKGLHFYFKEFPETLDVSSPGPFGVTCLDKDTCFAFNGTQFQADSYIYYSTDASMGKASTWTKATIPAAFPASTDITISAIFFAPDKTHGWAVGNNARHPMLLRTTDSGHTWADVSGQVSMADSDLVGGFALDANHIWVTGRYGFIGYTDTAQNN